MARLVFLGRLEDLAGAGEIALAPGEGASLAAVIARLPSALSAVLASPKVRIAVNGAVIAPEQALEALTVADSDEIAFLPPVSGG